MKGKKTAVLIWILCFLCMLVACGQKSTQTTGKQQTEVEEESGAEKTASDLKVGICIYEFEDDFMTLYRKELKAYLTGEYGIPSENITIVDSRDDQAEQDRQIEELIAQETDVLIINPVQVAKTQSMTELCQEAGIPVVFINREPEEAEIQRWEEEGIAAAYVGSDARRSGTLQGEIIMETPNKGDFNKDKKVSYVMIMGDAENVASQYRTEYSIKALEDGGMKTEKLFEQRGDWEEEKGQQFAAEALSRYGRRVEVIFCNNDAMANGARTAIQEAGRTVGKDIYLVGVDALEETVGYIKEGTVTGTVLNDHVGQAHAAADAAVTMASGGKAETKYTVDHVKIAIDSPVTDTAATAK